MAILLDCPTCGRENVNSVYCVGCKLAVCEEIIGHLKQYLLCGTPIPPHYVEVVSSNQWMTVQAYLESREKAESLKLEKAAWESRRGDAAQQFIREWEKQNPDPSPSTIQVGV